VLEGGEIPLWNPCGGEEITIETQSTPAGWYTDPAGSGGKRWWDGVQWTAHLQALTPPPPPPVVQEPQRVDPYSAANPYGLPAVQERGYIPMQRTAAAPVQYAPVRQGASGASIGYLIVGAIAFCLSLVGLMPGSTVIYYSAGGVIAIVGGVRALLHSRRGSGGSPIAPIIGIILGSLAVICMVAGIVIHTTATVSYGTGPVTQSQSGTGTGAGSEGDSSASVLPAPPAFAADPALSSYEASVAEVAKGVYGGYSSGNVVAADMNWPTTVQESPDGTVTLPNGTTAAKLPADQVVKIVVSTDGKYFGLFVAGGTDKEIAVYNSETNKFSWVCDTGAPTTCPAGGIPVTGDTATTNS
jgi:Protein of unknown function (DUF2510)